MNNTCNQCGSTNTWLSKALARHICPHCADDEMKMMQVRNDGLRRTNKRLKAELHNAKEQQNLELGV